MGFWGLVDIANFKCWSCNTTDVWSTESHPGESIAYLITTAVITTIGSLAVTVSPYSPWSSQVCGEYDAGSQLSNQSTNVRDRHTSVYTRGHSLDVPSSVVNTNGLPVSTVVSGDFTL